jgi:hypothetical protein
MNRYLILSLHIISLVLLGFGWVLDVLHINISVHYIIDFNLFNEKRSILGMLEKLWIDGNYWPFSLILLFGMIIPLVKSALIFYLLMVKNPAIIWQKFVSAISIFSKNEGFPVHHQLTSGLY